MFHLRSPATGNVDDGRIALEIDLPNVTRDDVDVTPAGSDLVVHVRDAQRLIALPDSVAGRSIEGVQLRDGVLRVVFAP